MRARAAIASAVLALAPMLLLAGCSESAPDSTREPAVTLPNAGARFDYQLGGPYPPPDGASIIVRDRLADPAGNGYDVCYVNGFQTQPDESAEFALQHPELVLHVPGSLSSSKGRGEPLVDPGWPDEYLLDASTEAKRTALAGIVGRWIRGCRDAGYAAVEIDNLDSFTRSEGLLTEKDNLALAAEYARIAHDAGLAIAQKNTAESAEHLAELGYDFAVTESCRHFDECGAYASVYDVVLDIEYADELGVDGFVEACTEPVPGVTMILRDHDLRMPGEDGYLHQACPAE